MIEIQNVDAVQVLTLSSGRVNAQDVELLDELTAAVLELQRSGNGPLVLTGAGRAFSAGGDLDWITSFLDDPAARDESLREGAQIIEELLRFPLPVITAVNGPAVGLGCSVAVLSDILLISDRAFLMDPHVSVGLVAGDGGAAFWPLLTPVLRSREYLYTGDRIPAATAVELGLASRVVPAEELMPEAGKLAHRLAAQPAQALRGTKRVAGMYLAQALGGAMQAGFAAERDTMLTAEHRDRVLALAKQAQRKEASRQVPRKNAPGDSGRAD